MRCGYYSRLVFWDVQANIKGVILLLYSVFVFYLNRI